MSRGAVLRGHAAQCRTDRFHRAEKLAMEAPVKMLLPLIGCIFPCTFIVLAFPIAVQLWRPTQLPATDPAVGWRPAPSPVGARNGAEGSGVGQERVVGGDTRGGRNHHKT